MCWSPSSHNHYPFFPPLLLHSRYSLHTVHLNCLLGTHHAPPSVVPLVRAALAAVTLLQPICQPRSSTSNFNFIGVSGIRTYITQSHLPISLIMSDRRQTYGGYQPRFSGGSVNRRTDRPDGRAQPPPSNSGRTFSTTSNPKSSRSYSNMGPDYYSSNSGQNRGGDSGREAQGYSGTRSSSSGGGCGVM